MLIIDTHCHLYTSEFQDDISQVIDRAIMNHVERFYLPAIDSDSTAAMLALEALFPGRCFAMMGLHPCSVKENFEAELDLIRDWFSKRAFIAVGECGLDFYWDKSFVQQQYQALDAQIQLALQYKVPIVLHTRNATRETIDVVKPHIHKGLKGVFHCFGGSTEEAREIIDMGFYMGIGGVVTYKNSGLAALLKITGLSNVILETDAPYLSPAPFRGKRNESSYLKHIVQKIAEVTHQTDIEIAAITTSNAEALFGKR